MKKIINYLLVALFAITTFVPFANAAMGTNAVNNGKITIDNAVNGETYSIYRILDLESYDTEREAYAYKATSKWASFLNSTAIKGVYVNIDDQGYVTWVNGADVEEFAKLVYASGIVADATTTAANNTATFTNLNLGYYLVNSTVGVICSLNTTNNEVVIKEKNELPSIEKEVTETNVSIGDTVNYTITLNNLKGIKNVVVTDTLSEGLTSNKDVVVKNNGVVFEDYEISYNGQTFTINNVNTANLENVVITYSATVNEKAVTNVANTNTAGLTYGNNQSVTTEPTETFTYGFRFHKVNGSNEDLTGAEFVLKTATGRVVTLVNLGNGNYRVATAAEIADENVTTTTVIEAGRVQIDGLAAGDYTLTETKAPEGYNRLASAIDIVITARNNEGTFTYEDTEVVNTTGAILPSTGGIGTTLFVMIGSVLIAAFGVSLITKFRMSKEY